MKTLIIKYKKHIIALGVVVIAGLYIIVTTKSGTEITLDKKEKRKSVATYVKGAVKREGKVYLKQGDKIKDAIDKSGGITEEADIENIKLEKELKDGDIVDVPIKERLKAGQEIEDAGTEKNGKVNINTASKEELMTLEGVGEKTATRIIEYRKKRRFESEEDIMNVSGIGEKKYEKIKMDVCI